MSQTPILHALSFAIGATDAAPDAELLRRFAEAGDHTAFELVVRRHAELVWGVCRAALPRDTHAAEDAFQATFLALARKAGSVRDRSAAGWLFRVARNAAVRARTRSATRQAGLLPDRLEHEGASAVDEAARREVAPVVAEEVDRLAAGLREPVVLCFFEGHTHTEAAARLGWPVGTVASRLARAKDVLRERLTRRGVVLPAAGLAGVFSTAPALTAARVQTALTVATGPAGGIPPAVLSLTQGVLSAMRFTRIKSVAAVVAVLAIGVSVALAALPSREQRPPEAPPNKPAEPTKKVFDENAEKEKRLKPLQGKWRVVMDAMSVEVVPADKFRAGDVERLSRTRVIVEGDKLTTDEGRMEDRNTEELRFPADGGPQAIDLVATGGDPKEKPGPTLPAIYKVEGDRLTLCIRMEEHVKKGRPTEFKADKTQVLEVFERFQDVKGELKALAGEWKGRRIIFDDDEFVLDKVAMPKWVFDGAEVVMTGAGEPCEKATIKLDPTETPPTIELTITQGKGKGTKLVGVYSRQDDKLTICFRDPKWKDVPPPTVLSPDPDVLYYTLERAPKK